MLSEKFSISNSLVRLKENMKEYLKDMQVRREM